MSGRTNYLVRGALIASLYTVFSLLFKFINIGGIEIRFSEMLCILPIYYSEAISGLFAGCLITNIISGNIFDIIFGSIATLSGAFFTYRFRKNKMLAYLSPIVSNSLIIPLVLKFGYGLDIPYLILLSAIFFGEAISVFVFGGMLEKFIIKKFKM